MWWYWLMAVLVPAASVGGLYGGFLILLTTQFVQTHAVYLHAFQMTGGKDLNSPESFGFLRGQVTPFQIRSEKDGNLLHAWHILPIALYRKHESLLSQQPEGLADKITSTPGFRLLREDPDARLVIHFHGAGGNIASGYRIPNYKALSAAQPDKIHVLTFDYRGFGLSPETPTESGLIADALAVVTWATDVAGIPPNRIVIFGQSLGTAVNLAVAEHCVRSSPAQTFAGHILVAPFCDVPTLVATYKIAGIVPILSPVAKLFPAVFRWLKAYFREEWATNRRLATYIEHQEDAKRRYRITLIHGEDDHDIPWQHSAMLFEQAVNATKSDEAAANELPHHGREFAQDFGTAGRVTNWRTGNGIITERILKYGLHDVIMGDPVITLATMRMFDEEDGI